MTAGQEDPGSNPIRLILHSSYTRVLDAAQRRVNCIPILCSVWQIMGQLIITIGPSWLQDGSRASHWSDLAKCCKKLMPRLTRWSRSWRPAWAGGSGPSWRPPRRRWLLGSFRWQRRRRRRWWRHRRGRSRQNQNTDGRKTVFCENYLFKTRHLGNFLNFLFLFHWRP